MAGGVSGGGVVLGVGGGCLAGAAVYATRNGGPLLTGCRHSAPEPEIQIFPRVGAPRAVFP